MRRRRAGAGLLAGLSVILLSACGGGAAFPDPDDAAVVAERDRVTEILREGTWLRGDVECRAQVLRQEGLTTWAWAHCESGESGFAGPVRFEGDSLQLVDGPTALDELFPEDLADQVIGTDNADYDLR